MASTELVEVLRILDWRIVSVRPLRFRMVPEPRRSINAIGIILLYLGNAKNVMEYFRHAERKVTFHTDETLSNTLKFIKWPKLGTMEFCF